MRTSRERTRPRFISNGLSGAGFGAFCGLMAFVYVLIARGMRLGTGNSSVSLLGLGLVYLGGGPVLGFLGGAARTWLPGRWGRITIGIALSAIGGAMALPLIPRASFPWGLFEWMVIAVFALILGPLLAAQHKD